MNILGPRVAFFVQKPLFFQLVQRVAQSIGIGQDLIRRGFSRIDFVSGQVLRRSLQVAIVAEAVEEDFVLLCLVFY